MKPVNRRGTLKIQGKVNSVLGAVFDLEESSGGNDGYFKKIRRIVRRLDAFPYEEPYRAVTSFQSGLLTIVFTVFFIITTVPEFTKLFSGHLMFNVETDASHTSFASSPIKLPKLFFTPGGNTNLRAKPYFRNDSYYRLEVAKKNIFESDSNPEKPRTSEKVRVEECKIVLDHFGKDNSMLGWCIDEETKIVGDYVRAQYTYLQIDVVPCNAYQDLETSGVVCASEKEINNIFHGKDSYVTMSLYTNQRDDLKFGTKKKWQSKVYATLPSNQWMGLEVYFKPYRTSSYNAFDTVIHDETFMMYDFYESRLSATRSNNVMRFYLRMSTESIVRESRVYTLKTFFSRLGGVLIFFYGLGTIIGSRYNMARMGVFKHIVNHSMKVEERNRKWNVNPVCDMDLAMVGGAGNNKNNNSEDGKQNLKKTVI
jgi:hypothetical protein